MTQKFANAARAYLASTVSDSATTVTIDGGGSLFPAITSPEFSRAVLQDISGIEVVLITAHTASSNSFTVTRAQEGTTARSFAAGSVFGLRMTAADGDTFVAKVSGPSSAINNAVALFDGTTGKLVKDSTQTIATANTASTVVARDASGDFSAGTITATLSGSATSATTATNLAGGAANQIPFQAGSGSTSFVVAPSATGQVLGWNGSAFAYTTTIATATNQSGGTVSATSITDSGNLTFTGTGNRITGDFSNATIANRAMFQTSTANTATTVSALPNGTDPTSVFSAVNNSDPTNAGNMSLLSTSTEGSLRASRFGTGTYLPMTFYTGGSEKVRVLVSGAISVGSSGTNTGTAGQVLQSAGSGASPSWVTPTTPPLTPVTYSYTGPVDPIAGFILSAPTPVQIGGVVEPVTGAFAQAVVFGDTRATSITFTNLQGVVGYLTTSNVFAFSIQYMRNLTSVNFPALTSVAGSFLANTLTVTSISLPLLSVIGGSFVGFGNSLTAINMPSLKAVGANFNPSGTAVTSMNVSALETVQGTLTVSALPLLTTMDLPSLKNVLLGFSIFNMGALTTITVPQVVVIAGAIITGTAISLTTGTAALTTFQLPTTLKQVGGAVGGVLITSAALNQASVDSILVRLAALDGTNDTIVFSNRAVTITGTSATPSATGLAAKATLVARGCTVTNN
jgi:hypothetical protein